MILSKEINKSMSLGYNSEGEQYYSPDEVNSKMNSSNFYPLMEIRVSDTKYRLLFSVDTQTYFDPIKKKWECWNYSGIIPYIGISDISREDSIEDFKLQIHIRFQQLYSKRPFEMTEEEHNEWIKLANTIDLFHYKTTTPLETHEVGCVSYGKLSYPHLIKWITDEYYTIDPSKVPGELISCKTGQWIEAVVKRDPVNNKVLCITSIKKIRFHIPKPEEAQDYWDSMEIIQLKKNST